MAILALRSRALADRDAPRVGHEEGLGVPGAAAEHVEDGSHGRQAPVNGPAPDLCCRWWGRAPSRQGRRKSGLPRSFCTEVLSAVSSFHTFAVLHVTSARSTVPPYIEPETGKNVLCHYFAVQLTEWPFASVEGCDTDLPNTP